MKKVTDLIKKINFPILCLVVFLLRLPPFYMLPIKSVLFTSHTIARCLLVFLFLASLILIYFKKAQLEIDKTLAVLILLYFVAQTFSIVTAFNPIAYLQVYKNIVTGLLIFIVLLTILDSRKKINNFLLVLLAVLLLDAVFETIIYFYPNLLNSYLEPFFYDKYWQELVFNINRQRFFIDIIDEPFIPLLFYFFLKEKKPANKLTLLAIVSLISFFALVSNWRSKLLLVLVALFLSTILYLRNLKTLVLAAILIFLLFYIGNLMSVETVGFNTLDRVITPTQYDISTIAWRFENWRHSLEIGLSSPFLGVGLGNYYDLSPSSSKNIQFSVFDWKNQLAEITQNDPHNIFFSVFAETGFFGLVTLLTLLLYFIKTDIARLKKPRTVATVLVLSFWVLFSFALFNPTTSLPFQALFWLFRGLILKSDAFGL